MFETRNPHRTRSRRAPRAGALPAALLALLALSLPGAPPTPAFAQPAPAAALAPVGAGLVFTTPLVFTNPLVPFESGAVKLFVGKSGGAKTAVVDIYLAETRAFDLGGGSVECAILQETEFEDGVVVEISRNHFAQADDGTVAYFGETVDIYESGAIVAHDGSWLVGGPTLPGDPVDTATAAAPAVFMPAAPAPSDTWKPEDLLPFVDETVTALDDDATISVPAGKFVHALKVEESTALGPETELKWYAPGVGVAKVKAKGEKLLLIASTLQGP